jgi:hypothetical protein
LSPRQSWPTGFPSLPNELIVKLAGRRRAEPPYPRKVSRNIHRLSKENPFQTLNDLEIQTAPMKKCPLFQRLMKSLWNILQGNRSHFTTVMVATSATSEETKLL